MGEENEEKKPKPKGGEGRRIGKKSEKTQNCKCQEKKVGTGEENEEKNPKTKRGEGRRIRKSQEKPKIANARKGKRVCEVGEEKKPKPKRGEGRRIGKSLKKPKTKNVIGMIMVLRAGKYDSSIKLIIQGEICYEYKYKM